MSANHLGQPDITQKLLGLAMDVAWELLDAFNDGGV
jgi:hypothetical protein